MANRCTTGIRMSRWLAPWHRTVPVALPSPSSPPPPPRGLAAVGCAPTRNLNTSSSVTSIAVRSASIRVTAMVEREREGRREEGWGQGKATAGTVSHGDREAQWSVATAVAVPPAVSSGSRAVAWQWRVDRTGADSTSERRKEWGAWPTVTSSQPNLDFRTGRKIFANGRRPLEPRSQKSCHCAAATQCAVAQHERSSLLPPRCQQTTGQTLWSLGDWWAASRSSQARLSEAG